MQRRIFVGSVLAVAAGLGAGVALLPAGVARAQRAGTAPLAIAATRGARRVVLRVYPGRSDRQFILRLRTEGRDSWYQMTLPQGFPAGLQAALSDGAMDLQVAQGQTQVDLRVALRRDGANLHFSATGGRSPIEGAATAPDEPGPTTRLGFLGAIVAIIAILGVVAIVGMVTGTPLSIRFRCRGMGCNLEMDVGVTPSPTPGPGPDGFLANPECDLFPPLLC